MSSTTIEPVVARPPEPSAQTSGMSAVWGIALASFVLHLLCNARYGYFRDEFDYIACGRHPAWGYVDQPPLLPILTRIFMGIFGDSLRSVRLLPALSSAALILLTGVVARELGGKRFAVALSALAVLVGPIYLSGGSLLTTNCDLEVVLWTGCLYFAILAAKHNDPRYWLWFGVVAGIGLEEKYSIVVLGVAVVAGLLLILQTRFLLNKWMWLGGLAALFIFLPNLLWNIRNDWPFVQLMHNIRAEGRDVVLSPWQFFSQQLLLTHFVSAAFWIVGVIALLVAGRFKPYRFLGWAYLVAFAVFVILKGKNYYLAPIYPVYEAAGAIVIAEAIDRFQQSWLKPAIIVLVLATGAVFAPLAMPILPIGQFIPYMNRLPIKVPRSEYEHERIAMPQHYADQFGWNEIVEKTAEAWQKIPSADRSDCAIFGQDYGQAGAIDFLGAQYHLPNALSGDRTWWLWGPRGYSGNCMIILGDRRARLEQLFEHVEYLGNSAPNPYALETEISVNICRGAKFGTLADLWPQLKHWH